MRDFNKVSPRVWSSKKFGRLGTVAKLFYVYLLTSPHCNSLGCYTLRIGYATADIGLTPAEAEAALAECVDKDMVEHDEAEDVVRIKQFISFNPPTNVKHAMKMLSDAKAVTIKGFRDILMEEILAECVAKPWEGLDKLFEQYRKATDTLSHTLPIHKTITSHHQTETETITSPPKPEQLELDQGAPFKSIGSEISKLRLGGDGSDFDILKHIDDDDIEKIRFDLYPARWDIKNELAPRYNDGIKNGVLERPRHPAKAFKAWCKSYTKGKKP